MVNDNKRYLRLSGMLDPRSIAFVGGSALEPSIAYTRALGFDGDYFVINPKRKRLAGIDCTRRAADLPSVPDLAFVAVPAAAAIDAVRDLAAAGVGAAIVNSAGFAETGPAGAELQARLIEAAGEMPLLGPNCPGIANLLDGVGAMLDHFGNAVVSRGVAVLSSGAAYLADISYADRSLPVAYLAGLGNQAGVSIAEIMDLILDDERVSAINLHLESIRDVARLSRCALKAHRKGIPVIAIKAGKTTAGQRAARLHTASLASEAEITSALFSRLGFVEVESASAALETMKMLTLGPAPRGSRVALATSSGTYAVMGADFAVKHGLALPPVPEASRARLQPLIEDFMQAANPLDIATAQFWPDDRQVGIFAAFLQDDYDIALQTMSFPAANTWEDESWYRSAAAFARAARDARLPCVFLAPTHEGLPRKAREMLIELGVVPLQDFDYGMAAIARALDWHRRRRRLNPDNMLLSDPPALASSAARTLDEAESKSLLAAAGVPVPRGQRLGAGEAIPEGLPYPVILKVCDPQVLHKSDIGGVSAKLANPELLGFAREQMSAVLRRHGHPAENFLVEQSVHGALAELLVGIRQVPGIGYSLTLAIGGSAVELLRDAATLLLPSTRDRFAAALGELRLYPLLTGARGTDAADLDCALDVIETLAALVASRRDIVELEVNPLILRAEGHGCVAADAVIRIKPQ